MPAVLTLRLSMPHIILFNKPFNVLSQFTDAAERQTLSHYLSAPECRGFYPAGRLDRDSEGLLILTDDGVLQDRICHPQQKMPKTYWVQVEGLQNEDALNKIRRGLILKDGPTAPAKVRILEPSPSLWQREPPIRARTNIPTSWLEISITEGRNRQVRRMTAAVGLPTLRLIRVQVGPWSLGSLSPGEYAFDTVNLAKPAAGLPQATRKRIRR